MTASNRRYYFNSVLIWTLFMFIMIFSLIIDVSQASSLSSVQPIKEVLDIHQGYDTDLSDPTPFGMTFSCNHNKNKNVTV